MIPEYIEKLHDVYWRLFLPGLARCDPLVLECLEKAYCEIDLHNGRVLFKLPKLFHAVWFFGVEKGLEMPKRTSWSKDFYAFCKPLKFPFLTLPDEVCGISIELKSNVNSKINNNYLATIMCITNRHTE